MSNSKASLHGRALSKPLNMDAIHAHRFSRTLSHGIYSEECNVACSADAADACGCVEGSSAKNHDRCSCDDISFGRTTQATESSEDIPSGRMGRRILSRPQGQRVLVKPE
ncbi:hypothetical protein CRV24_006430 [Beauveria bassiana]|nr:hypothetical protein CRV24_006430 [Beauveria bassiana]